MRIALLTDGITPYVTGGMQRHSFNICRFLAGQGVYVDLYHCDPQQRIAKLPDVFTEEERKYITSIVIRFPDFGKMPGHYIRESYEYSRLIAAELSKRQPVDFIYAKGFTAWHILSLRDAGKIKLPPVGVNFHGYEMFQHQSGFLERLKSNLLLKSPVIYNISKADYVFSYGGKITEIIAGIGVNRNRIAVIPGAVDEQWVRTAPEQPHDPICFLFVGRNEVRKGLKELLQGFHSAFGSASDKVELIVVGSHPKHKAGGNVKFIGEITSADKLKEVYAAADVLVTPSYAEGFPNVILEAMANGLAVIATETGAVSMLVGSDTGILLKEPHPDKIAEALKSMAGLSKQNLYELKSASIKKVQERFTWQKSGAVLMDFLETLPVNVPD